MENIALVLGMLIKWLPLFLGLIGIIRLLAIAKDGKKHFLTKGLTLISIGIWMTLSIQERVYRAKMLAKIVGDYKLLNYNCEDCSECIVKLETELTYLIIVKDSVVNSGVWDFESELGQIFLKIENGPQNSLIDTSKTIPYIGNIGCQEYWRNKNFEEEINGMVIEVDTVHKKFGLYSILVEDEKTKSIIRYQPKYLNHPWINGYISVGDHITKSSKSMKFIIINANNDSVIVEER